MKIRFIVNPFSGKRRKSQALVTEAVREALADEEGIFEIRVASEKGSAAVLSKEALDKGYEIIFACGGDGTISEVAAPLVGTDVILGIIPIGSGNALASSLGIPKDMRAAVGLIKNMKVREIDVGAVCGRYFLTTAGFAFEAHLSRSYAEGALSKRIRGLAPYYPLALKEFLRYSPEPVTIKTPQGTETVTPFLLSAANTGQFGGGAFISPGASLDDGLIDICIVEKPGIYGAMGLARKLFSKSVHEMKTFRCIRTEQAEISGRSKTLCHADGEPFEWEGDIKIGILPKKLKVFVEYL